MAKGIRLPLVEIMTGRDSERGFLGTDNVLFFDLRVGSIGMFRLWKTTKLYVHDLCTFL